MPRPIERGTPGLRFGRSGDRPVVRGRVVGMMGMLLVVAAMMLSRRGVVPSDGADERVVVEVRGDVPEPGFHLVSRPGRLADALEAAGASVGTGEHQTLAGGTRVIVEDGSVRQEAMEEVLVVGLPVDVNMASATALGAVPGLGPKRSAAIVAERDAGGPYLDVDALTRVRGIGPATVERIRPFVTAKSVRTTP